MLIPSLVLKQLYTFGSLKNVEGGVKFSLKNRLSDATLTGVYKIKIDGSEAPKQALSFDLGNNQILALDQVSSKKSA